MAKHESAANRQELFDEAFLKKLEYLHIVSKKIFSGQSLAERKTKRVGSGIEFADHRDYAPGDDFRYVDWAILGRLDRVLLRLFEAEEDLHIYILLDISDSLTMGRPPKLHYAMQIAAALAYIGLANLDRVSISTLSDGLKDRLPPARGKGRIFKVFEFLRSITPGGQTKLQPALKTFVHQNKRRGLVVLLSDFYDPKGYQDAINILRYNRFDAFMIQLYDKREATPTIKGDLQLVDCETGAIKDVTVTAKMLQRYKEEHQRYCDQLEEFCVKKQVPLVLADTRIPFDELILNIFRRGGFLR